MKVDFHVHSTASDGTFEPGELVEMAERGAFAAFALTDHDNCDGVAEFLGAGSSVPRIAGVELSIEPGEGFDKFHLLALGVDPGNAELKAFLRRILEGRNGRNERIFANFHRLGIDIKPEPHGEVLARPHFARWLMDHGYAPDVKTAFRRYLTPASPSETNCYVTRYHPDPGEAFDVIHAAGGVAVMAHPRYWTKDPALLRAGLARLKARGLDGVEAVYQANEPGETVDHLRAAKELALCVTAGSDFHGANKPTITLGMAVDDEEAFIAPFLDCLARRRKAAQG